MEITVIVAGTNEPSNANVLADAFIEGIKKQKGLTVTKFRLKEMELEHFNLKHYSPRTDQGKDFEKLKKAILSSQGVVITSPIWNFSVPAHLKNFIDRIGSFALDATHSVGTLGGKPFYLLYTGGAPTAAFPALIKKTTSHMGESIKYFGGAVMGAHYEERCTLGRGKFGLVVDKRPKTLAEMRKKGEKFALIAHTFGKTGKLPWKQTFMTWAYKTAGRVKRKMGI